MQIWIIYALTGAFFAGLVPIFAKLGLKQIDSTLATTVRSCVMASFLIATSFVLGKFQLIHTLDKKSLMLIAFSGIAGALSWLFNFAAIAEGLASSASALDRLSIVFVYIFAFMLLGERFSAAALLGSAMIALGAILMTIK